MWQKVHLEQNNSNFYPCMAFKMGLQYQKSNSIVQYATNYFQYNQKYEKISEESRNMKFLHAVGPIAISLAVWPQLIAENERKIWHIVPSLWQTTVSQN